jgi:NAD(P)-dependent dehydrogenase (short-subunit alcohol dehydrogenase family)
MPDIPKPQQTLVMTGASSGIGRYAARYLLRDYPAHHLLLLVRSGRGEQIAAELAAETRNPNVSAVPCDLASLSDIRAAAAEIGSLLDSGALPPLRGFLGNAGVQQSSLTRTTADGFEMTFGVNVLANYLLTRLLLDSFAPPSRIVITGSDVHFADFRHNLGVVPRPRWSDTAAIAAPGTGPAANSAREGQRAYATSKLAVIYLVHALARRVPEGVDVYTYNPGGVPGTGLAREASPALRAHRRNARPRLAGHPVRHRRRPGRTAARRCGGRTPAGRDRRLHRPRENHPLLPRLLRQGPRGGTLGRRRPADRHRPAARALALRIHAGRPERLALGKFS